MKLLPRRTNTTHPVGFHVCCITVMLERLAYYGIKPILLLFLITSVAQGGLGIDTTEATILTANLIAYTAIAPMIGGVISDRWLGARYAVTAGILLMAVGYGMGWLAADIAGINLMILLVSIGTGLFKGNINTLIGCQYKEQSQLDAAFSIQYSYINIGTFVGSLVTGYLYLHVFAQEEILGFRQCFLVAACYCVVAAIWFVIHWEKLQGQGMQPNKYLSAERGMLTKIERQHIISIVIVAFLSVIFWLFYFQQDLSLVIYMSEFVNMNVCGFVIPTSWVTTSWNGLLCIILGGVMAKIWKRLAMRPQGDVTIFSKISYSFAFLGIAFGVMALCEYLRITDGGSSAQVSVLWPLIFISLLTIGEMCFSPLRHAMVSKYAPKQYLSLLMGVIASSSFFANKLSPYIQIFVNELKAFTVFAGIFLAMIFLCIILLCMHKKLNSLLGEESQV